VMDKYGVTLKSVSDRVLKTGWLLTELQKRLHG